MNEKQTKCLICEKVTKRMTRGLCQGHYLQFTRMKKKIEEQDGKEAAEAWDRWLVSQDKVLEPFQENEFGEFYQAYQKEIAVAEQPVLRLRDLDYGSAQLRIFASDCRLVS